MKTFAFLACLLGAAVASGAVQKEQLKKELAAMEDQFSAMAQEKGVLAAFEHFAAPDVAFIDTDPRQFRGPTAVKQRMGTFPAGAKLTWSAYFTDVSDDGTLGYNYGRYEISGRTPDGTERKSGGWFLSICEKATRRLLALRDGHRRARPPCRRAETARRTGRAAAQLRLRARIEAKVA